MKERLSQKKCLNDLADYYSACGSAEDIKNFETLCLSLGFNPERFLVTIDVKHIEMKFGFDTVRSEHKLYAHNNRSGKNYILGYYPSMGKMVKLGPGCYKKKLKNPDKQFIDFVNS